jgi:hypothetical protein
MKWIMLFTTTIKHWCSTKKMIAKYIKGPQALNIENNNNYFQNSPIIVGMKWKVLYQHLTRCNQYQIPTQPFLFMLCEDN